MTPEELMRAVRRSRIPAVFVLLAVTAAFVVPSVVRKPDYHVATTFSVQPPATHGVETPTFSASSLQFLVPVVQERLQSKQLQDTVAADASVRASRFTAESAMTPNSGLVTLTLTSRDKGALLPLTRAYVSEMSSYPSQAKLPIALTATQLPTQPVTTSRAVDVALAAIEGVALGLLLAIGLSVALGKRRRRRDIRGRVTSRLGVPTLAILRRDNEGGATQLEGILPAATFLTGRKYGGRPLVVGVVSTRAGVGRSLVAVGLAQALGASNQPVELVELDLRGGGLPTPLLEPFTPAPTVAAVYPGLTYLSRAEIQSRVRRNGPVSRQPAALVLSALRAIVRPHEVFERAIVLDVAAGTEQPDVDVIIPAADGVVLVLDGRSLGVALDEAEVALHRIAELGGHCYGVIVNRSGRQPRTAEPVARPAEVRQEQPVGIPQGAT